MALMGLINAEPVSVTPVLMDIGAWADDLTPEVAFEIDCHETRSAKALSVRPRDGLAGG
jgi:hypothetical protein